MRKKSFSPSDKFQPYQDEELIRRSALKIIDFVVKDPEIHPHVRNIIIGYMQWSLTEIKQNLKYNTRYYSEKAFEQKEPPRHEHVYPQKYIKNLILTDNHNFLDMIPKIVGCTVTVTEASILTKNDKKCPDLQSQGWQRYKKAGIRVFDRLKQRFLW